MSIEDVYYLKNNSIKQSYTFLVDSKDRDRSVYPTPSEYVITFSNPFRNVIGLEVIDASIPRTMYSIDSGNNVLYYYLGTTTDDIILNGLYSINTNGVITPDISKFVRFEMPVGDYTIQTFIPAFNKIMTNANIDLQIKSLTNPPELNNLIKFISTKPFIIEMSNSTIAETLGFDLYANINENNSSSQRYEYKTSYFDKENFQRIYHSIYKDNVYIIVSPGMIYFMGDKYLLLRCPEIEQHLYRSLSYSKYNLGLAKFRINGFGFNDEKLAITKIPTREFHPIGKLAKMSFRFETPSGALYDFKGVNHNVIYAIYYYEPKQMNLLNNSILNPEYKSNFLDYIHKEEEQEGESDEEEDYSRDNIEIYKKNEMLYNKNGLYNNKIKIIDHYNNNNNNNDKFNN
jgi:hypothetical protein